MNTSLIILLSAFFLMIACGNPQDELLLKEAIQKAQDSAKCKELLTQSPFAEGDGSEESPYVICTEDQFNQIATKIVDDISYNTKFFALYADLDFDNKTLNMIGDTDPGFQGNFDGRNYTISNISLNVTTNYTGVFRRIGVDATVKNLTLKDVNIIAKSYTGALAGWQGGVVRNVKSTGVVTGTENVGGLVGRVWTTNNNFGIWDSSSSATITGTGNFVGGIVGWTRNAMFENVFATGNVQTAQRAGGLIGIADQGVYIKSSYATGNVTITGTTGMGGGLVGAIIGKVESSYSTGNVTANSSGYVGGIAGTFSGQLLKSYSSSSISAGVYVVGGLVGYMYASGSIANSYFNGTIATSVSYVGGIVGYNAGSPLSFSYVASSSITGSDPGALQGGTASAALSTSFWDNELSGISGDFIDDMTTKVTTNGLDSATMKTRSTFINAGYDETIWSIEDGKYPTLK